MPGRRAPPDTANLKEIPYANESRVEMAGGVCGHGGPGFRHRRGLPMRGQRTRTNARTRKGPRKGAAALKK